MTQDKIIEAAKAVIARWDSHDWKDATHTADYIHALRDAVNDAKLASQAQPTPSQSVDAEREKVVTQKEVDNLFEENKENFGFNKFFTAKTWFDSLSEPQPTSKEGFVLVPIKLQYNQMRKVIIEYFERAANQECFLFDDFWSDLIKANIDAMKESK